MRSQTSFPYTCLFPTRLRLFGCVLLLFCTTGSSVHAATIPVSNTNDTGPGSLRNALATTADGDTINCSVTGTVTLTSGELLISNSVNIIGPGPGVLAVNGNGTNRVFYIGAGKTVVISGLTVTNGAATSNPFPGFSGGGIYNDHATLTVSNCTISGNSATGGFGGGIFHAAADSVSGPLTIVNTTLSGNTAPQGGAIYNYGSRAGNATITILNSTLDRNSATFSGGGIYNGGGGSGHASITIVNSTLSSNSAVWYGGGLHNDGANFGQATAEIDNSTLSGNWSTSTGGAIYNDAYLGNTSLTIVNSTLNGNSGYISGGIYNNPVEGNATFEVGSTILNAGASGANFGFEIHIATVDSLGYNLCSDDGRGFLTAAGDQINTDPLLGALRDNGGPTLTHKPLACSPAIDQGKNFSILTTDQRGDAFVRTFDNPDVPNPPGGDGTDIGAVEAQTNRVNSKPVAKCKDVTISAGSNCTANVSIDDGSYDPDDGDAITLTQTPPGPYSIGITSVTLTATDRCGASNDCTASVTVVDDTPPSITCPPTQSVAATSSTGAIVDYPAPKTSDNCSVSTVCVPAAGTVFQIGDTTVTCTATDGAGNTNSCTFSVHVQGVGEQLTDAIAAIADFGLNASLARNLTHQLQNIGVRITKGKTATACSQLKKFITFVTHRQTKGKLPAGHADELAADATRIRGVLGCN